MAFGLLTNEQTGFALGLMKLSRACDPPDPNVSSCGFVTPLYLPRLGLVCNRSSTGSQAHPP